MFGDNILTTTYKTEEYRCPCCGHTFECKTVTTITHEGQDSDFLPHFIGSNPLPFYLAKCPVCYFVAYPEDYEGWERISWNRAKETFKNKPYQVFEDDDDKTNNEM